MSGFRIAHASFDTAAMRDALMARHAGAFAAFEGWVRNNNDGRAVTALSYEAYATLAEAEGSRVIEEARTRFAVIDAACVHRIGRLEIGELAVWVGVSAGHRDAAFTACRWIIDEVKHRVPIWKQEHYENGEAGWLHPQEGKG